MTQERIVEILKELDVLQEGHFLYTSGKHGAKYMQCAKIFKNAKYSEELCRELALKYKDEGIELVIGPAIGAIQMAYEVSRHLGVENFFTERENGAMVLRRGFEIKKDARVLVVEDVVTTGGTVNEVVALVESLGGKVAGVGSIVDRTGGKNPFPVQFKAVIEVDAITYDAEHCPLCAEGKIPLTKPGSRNIPVK